MRGSIGTLSFNLNNDDKLAHIVNRHVWSMSIYQWWQGKARNIRTNTVILVKEMLCHYSNHMIMA